MRDQRREIRRSTTSIVRKRRAEHLDRAAIVAAGGPGRWIGAGGDADGESDESAGEASASLGSLAVIGRDDTSADPAAPEERSCREVGV
jgi:hypothetical protein